MTLPNAAESATPHNVAGFGAIVADPPWTFEAEDDGAAP
jgi:hypothetical protein